MPAVCPLGGADVLHVFPPAQHPSRKGHKKLHGGALLRGVNK